jgi:subtilisin family serine protease
VQERYKDGRPRVKVAIIDTGIDGSHPLLKPFQENDQIRCKSWIEGEPADVDDNGHGTHVAHSLFKVAARAELYIAKVFKTGKEDELEQNKALIANVRSLDPQRRSCASMLTNQFGRQSHTLVSGGRSTSSQSLGATMRTLSRSKLH